MSSSMTLEIVRLLYSNYTCARTVTIWSFLYIYIPVCMYVYSEGSGGIGGSVG